MKILGFDHIVLTVQSISRSVEFYRDVLGMREVNLGDGRIAVHFGKQKINLHPEGEFKGLVAKQPTTGSGDICLITDTPIETVIEELQARKISVEVGPVDRTGAVGKIRSVYIRDPDFNLIEISNYQQGPGPAHTTGDGG